MDFQVYTTILIESIKTYFFELSPSLILFLRDDPFDFSPCDVISG